MLFNIATLALLAAAMMLAARAFAMVTVTLPASFSPLILHAGNWENLFWMAAQFAVWIELVAVYLLIRAASCNGSADCCVGGGSDPAFATALAQQDCCSCAVVGNLERSLRLAPMAEKGISATIGLLLRL